jgi:PAS domain S-box-containing protein
MDNIFDSIVSGVITTDSQGRVTKLNTASLNILGLNAREDVTGHHLKDLLPDFGDSFYDQLETVFSSGQAILIEAQSHHQNGKPLIWNVTASVLYELDGHNKGLALVIDDLTEQKQREAQLAEVGRYLPRALIKNFRMVDRVDIGYEEREITAVFADVRGFTAFSEKLEPETLMRIINKYLTVASDAIDFWEGIVDKYMGDAVTGLFNTQLNPQPDHAIRAVQSALGIIFDVTNGLHDVLPEDQHLFYGIGIHTGMAVLGNIGSRERKEFGALGEATDICKVLQENAKGGDIIISPATYAYIEEDFDCEEVTLEKTKGFDLTVGYRVLRRKKGSRTTTNIFIDDELADLLRDN